MGGKTAIAAGLLLGVLAGGGALAAVVYLAPDVAVPVVQTPEPTAGPVASQGSPSPATTPSPIPSPTPSVVASPTSSASPSSSTASGGPASPVASGASPATSGPGASPSASPGSAGLFHVGEPAPSLVVARLGGGTIDLSTLRGKPVWVNFMATWCLPCRDELPLMAGYAIRYQSQGLVVLTIDVGEDESTVGAFMRSLGVSFSTGLDLDSSAQATWGAYALPVHFWVDASGIIRDGALGEIGPDIMARGLQSILPGVEVTP